MNQFAGQFAALATSLMFATTSTIFTFAGRRVGSVVLNRTRLVFALVLLVSTHWVIYHVPFPFDAGPQRFFWLGLSGVIGLVLGDALLYQAFVWIGPRLSMLMMSLAPVIAAVVAWVFLGERLSLGQAGGIALTLLGVSWVILDRRSHSRPLDDSERNYGRGVLFALGGATGQAVGMVSAKAGLAGAFPALSGTLIRMLTAAVALWLLTFLQGQGRYTLIRLQQNRKALPLILLGSISGPFLGVTFSLFAVQRATVGVASTLMALAPVFLLPVGYLVFKERFGWQAVAGTLLAMVGVALLFIV